METVVKINNPNSLDNARFRIRDKHFSAICTCLKDGPAFLPIYLTDMDGNIFNLQGGYFVKPNNEGIVRLQTIKGFMNFNANDILENSFPAADLQRWREGIRKNEVVAWNYKEQSRSMAKMKQKMTLD